MCGIVGMFDTQGQREPSREVLRLMNQIQLHRGPDEGGELFAPGVALGHRRLSIIDLSSGQQPLYNEDGSVGVVFNGEIYNFPELTKELAAAGHVFRTHSDTEVIVHAWEQWGADSVKRFNGMFAYAIWDSRQQVLFLARDRLGKKPIYYTVTPDGWLYFASELKSLSALKNLDRRIDIQAVEEYFAFGYVPDPRSILQSVRKLPPAHTLLCARGKPPQLREYWDVSFKAHTSTSEADTERELVERFRETVRIRLMSEVPLGAFLSGGVDSSAVVAMMAGLSSAPVNTCSISFDDPRYDEVQYAKQVADKFATNHRVERVKTDDFELLDKLGDVYDEPFADSSAIPTYRVCQLARKHVTVALSGDGGDESFAGYRRYRWHMHEERIRSMLPLAVRRPLFGALGKLYPKIDWAPPWLRAKSTFESLAWDSVQGYFHTMSVMPDRIRLPLYSADLRRELNGYHALEVFRAHAARAPTRDPLSLVQYIDMKTYLPGDILVKVDRAAMAHSLEVRVPILDYTFIDWVSGLDPSFKLRNGEGKYLFKKSMEAYLPRDLMYRRKMGFAVPLKEWFAGPLRDRMRDVLLGPSLLGTGMFERERVQQLVDEHASGLRDHSAALWALMMFGSSMQALRAQA
jgi:asparagine synthase (glutamine-hydrolysing)